MPMERKSGIVSFFSKMPEVIPLYESIEEKILERFEDVSIEIKKTQITFKAKRGFVYVWLPIRKIKNRPAYYVVLSFGLDKRIESSRIAESVETFKNRWMHHLIIEKPDELDDELMSWIQDAYLFARNN
jgi:predicted transport protein